MVRSNNMPIKKVIFFSNSKEISALEVYRVYSPLSHAGIEVFTRLNADPLILDGIIDSQLVLYQRDFSRNFTNYQKVVQYSREHGKPIVLDLDDHLLALPSEHPDRISTKYASSLVALLYAIITADAITVTTPQLKKVIEPYNSNIYILPNYVDDSIWNFKPPKYSESNEPVKILFMGTLTHKPDLELIVDPLINIALKYGENILLEFYGLEPPRRILEIERIRYFPVKTYNYKEFVSDLSQIDADIAIAPLGNNLFNRCKSPIKFFEYTALGLPGVFSRIDPYSNVIDDGFDGFLAGAQDEWEEKICQLIERKDLRRELACNAQNKVQRNWMMSDHAQLWSKTYSTLINQKLEKNPIGHQYLQALNSIAIQLEEHELKQQSFHMGMNQESLDQNKTFNKNANIIKTEESNSTNQIKNEHYSSQQTQHLEASEQLRQLKLVELQQAEQIKLLSKHILGLSSELDFARREVVEYVLSNSWQITRLLRKIGRIIRRK